MNDQKDTGGSESTTRNELESNIRRTYAPVERPSLIRVSNVTDSVDYEDVPGEMKYGAIAQFQVVPEQGARGVGHTVYGLGYDGGVYLWDRERKAWTLVNK